MAGKTKPMVRKPASKFPHLQKKKLREKATKGQQAKKK